MSADKSPQTPQAGKAFEELMDNAQELEVSLGPEERKTVILATLAHHINQEESSIRKFILKHPIKDSLAFHHALIFNAMRDLYAKGQSVDKFAVRRQSHDLAEYDDPSIYSWDRIERILDEIFDAQPLEDQDLVETYLNEIVEWKRVGSTADRLNSRLSQLQEAIREGKAAPIYMIAGEISEIVSKIAAAYKDEDGSSLSSLKDILKEVIQSLARTHGSEFIGLPTGSLPTFDRYTLGIRGFNVVAGAPGVGKTNFCTQVGTDAVASDEDVCLVFFSFEMSKQEMALRLLSRASGLDWEQLMRGDESAETSSAKDGLCFSRQARDWFNQGIEQLESVGNRIFFLGCEDAQPDALFKWMTGVVQAAKARSRCSKAIILVDSLQSIPVQDVGSNEVERDNYVLGELRSLQRELEDAFLLVSEQNKEGMGAANLKSPRGTARAVYLPDCVMCLVKLPDDEAKSAVFSGKDIMELEEFRSIPVDLVIVKGRDGIIRSTIKLMFMHTKSSFVEAPDRPTISQMVKEKKKKAKKASASK